MKIEEGSRVIIKATGQMGVVFDILPNPYVPEWLNWLAGYTYVVVTVKRTKTFHRKNELQLIRP